MPLPAETLARIQRIVADYPDAPPDILEYHWHSVPRDWDHLRVPLDGDRSTVIRPREEDQHGGLRFRVGWDARERVAAIWLL